MSSNVHPSSTPGAAPQGLPPVVPPSGKHIVQMFLVPGFVVAFIILLVAGAYWLFGGPRSPKYYLDKLDDPNEEVRWRTAADLAQVLPRDKDLAADADFALQIAARLDDAVRANEEAEKRLA